MCTTEVTGRCYFKMFSQCVEYDFNRGATKHLELKVKIESHYLLIHSQRCALSFLKLFHELFQRSSSHELSYELYVYISCGGVYADTIHTYNGEKCELCLRWPRTGLCSRFGDITVTSQA